MSKNVNNDVSMNPPIDESQAENRPVPVQEAEIRWKKGSLVGRLAEAASLHVNRH